MVLNDDSAKWQENGSPAEWSLAARLLEGQSRGIFLSCVALAAPVNALRREFENIVVEVIGEDVVGASSICGFAASIWGGDPTRQGDFREPWPRTLAALEASMNNHSGCLLPFERIPAIAPDRASRQRFAEIVERLCLRGSTNPLVSLISGRTSILTQLTAIAPNVVPDLIDHIITIPGPANARFGVFDKLPPGITDIGQLIRRLDTARAAFNGAAIRAFLRLLMKESHMPRRRIRKWVNRFIRRFVKATGVDRNDAAALRVARFFGLIYAAGCLGKLWGILPSNWRIGRAVIDCYHAHLSAVETTGPISAFEQMLEYMRRYRHEIIDLRSDKRRIDDATFAKAPGFLNAGPRDTVELQIPPHRMRSEFPKDRTYR